MNDRYGDEHEQEHEGAADAPNGKRLSSAIRLLRAAPPVREVWRERLLERVQAEAAVATSPSHIGVRRRRWSVHPVAALAACLACAMVGAAITYGALRWGRRQSANAPVIGAVGRSYPVRFSLEAPAARHVAIVGDFNEWNPASQPMRRSSDGRTWTIDVGLPAGTYEYAFVVDHRLALDPRAPQSSNDDFGMPNSIRLVAGQ